MSGSVDSSGGHRPPYWQHAVIDLLPPVVFGLTYLVSGSMAVASLALVGGSAVSLVLGAVLQRRLAPLPLLIGFFGTVTAALTFYFNDPRVLEIKETIVKCLVGVTLIALAAAHVNPFRNTIASRLLTDAGMFKLMGRWGLLTLALAVMNEIVRRTQSQSVWVAFHFPGVLLIHLAFLATQWPWLLRDHRRRVNCLTTP